MLIHGQNGRRRQAAFTLVELLVVVVVLAILFALVLPALAGARGKARTITCLGHLRQLHLACLLYAGDFADALPYNLGSAEIRRRVAQGFYENWTSPIMSWELEPDNTNHILLTQGGIGSYASRAAPIYLCPEDSVVSDLQARQGLTHRVRSVSMNAMVGDAGEFSRGAANANNPHYRQFRRFSQIPEPSKIFVLIEEHPDSVNDGYFLNRFYSGRWLDLPASWHAGSANLTFADGHAELRKWRQPSTRPPSRPDAAHLPFRVPPDEREDYDWLMERTSVDVQ